MKLQDFNLRHYKKSTYFLFINIPGTSPGRDGTSRNNIVFALAAMDYIKRLFQHFPDLKASQICLITPYFAQLNPSTPPHLRQPIAASAAHEVLGLLYDIGQLVTSQKTTEAATHEAIAPLRNILSGLRRDPVNEIPPQLRNTPPHQR